MVNNTVVDTTQEVWLLISIDKYNNYITNSKLQLVCAVFVVVEHKFAVNKSVECDN